MSPAEAESLIRGVNEDIERIARAAQSQRQVRDAIRFRAQNPLEEQLIDEDSYAVPRGQPRVLRVGDVELKIWKIHRAGLDSTDIKGADLYYEMDGTKFVLVQYKSPSGSGRVKKDSSQLTELTEACPNRCPPTERFSCGSWFALHDGTGGSYHTACEANNIFGAYASRKKDAFINGLTKTQFEADFASCRIGGRSAPIRVQQFQNASVNADHIFFRVQQRFI